MAIPPFPPHDLAKLVLGYLAEEHLMTAYDEFLQASPYLDVFRNEYDRIFMTSLKSILAEYRAVKIYGSGDKEKQTVSDCSTSENFITQTTKENRKNGTPIPYNKGPVVAQYFVRTGTLNTPLFHGNQNLCNMPKSHSYVRIKEKPDDQKVQILSDVKVDTFKGNNSVRMPQVLRSNTSNSMLQMQTIFINGSPAYAYKRQTGASVTYTKDEIMAMPTIIVVPSSGTTQGSQATYSQSNVSSSTSTITSTTNATTRVLGPLVIDVPNSPTPKKSSTLPDLNPEDPDTEVSENLVRTVDVTAASLPKDSNIAVPNKTSTPNVIPPARKSSSTPRRNSHVRVLDFATPRRILHETINENDPNQQSTESSANGTEVIPSGPTELPVHTNIVTDDKYDAAETNNKSKNTSCKENKSKIVKKSNWDAELRALVLGKEFSDEAVVTPKPKLKRKKKKKKISPVTELVPETPEADSTKTTYSTSHTTSKSNESIKSFENVEPPMKEVTPKNTATETITSTECDGSANVLNATEKNQMKGNTSEDRVDTPEAERLSLQNVIGAKLNISDLLETPYKQALYDIQMETPKFLGPDLPDEPISDIKIMSIPTPRFLNTPKPLQATPSSYASRPTDYSSGSSYYKPDDHDFIPSDVLQCAGNITEDSIKPTNNETDLVKLKEKDKSEKPCRPQRKCTKNVSYKSPNVFKSKDDDSFEVTSVSSETSNKSTKDKLENKSIDSKTRMKSKTKSASKKKVVYKSPLKPKHFMKIKPRRSTPIKESSSKGRKKTLDVADKGSSIPRKRTTSKDKNTSITPFAAAAPTKSRRKSSTPRKLLNCIKPFNPETVVQNVCSLPNGQEDVVKETIACQLQDSDTEQLALRWSDDGSQDAKPKENEEQPTSSSLPEDDEITKIQEYIETSAPPTLAPEQNCEGSLQIDLIKRGFDVETAKSIERDLLDTTPIQDTAIQSTSNEEISVNKNEVCLIVSDRMESASSTANNLPLVHEEDEVEEIELTVNHCHEDSENFVLCQFDESTFVPTDQISKLKDKFSVELCVDDDLTIRLRANAYTSLFDMEPEEPLVQYDNTETEDAVSSISNIDKLYTPLKDTRAQCYEIFDSTLTSIDTPLKSDVTEYETKVTEIVLEVERIKEDVKEKAETKKRKRLQSGTLEESLIKKSKPDTQYLLNSANIQNIDIESVLSKLHGP
ncbi:jg13955 [Pararge aegeria aegeria]|uniref:Jg13955 protein n=1 Tax=Pararge aegeria aegeria TaxID=348720 RepID=A0A8S4RYD3_9NEOP|nr:jg13955 [Pararge aegeria aegeria]